MKITVFKLTDEIKNAKEKFVFSLHAEASAPRPRAHSSREVIARYLDSVKQWHERERNQGDAGGAPFIDPPIRRRMKKGEDAELIRKSGHPGEEEERGERSTPVKLEKLLKENRKFVLVADSGMGKTTLLKEMAFRMAAVRSPAHPVPIYFHLKELLDVFDKEALLIKIIRKFSAERRQEGLETVRSLFEDKRFFFLIDGLDQVERPTSLPDLIGKHGVLFSHRVILASRPFAYSSQKNQLSDFEYLTLDTFTVSQAKIYLGQNDPSFKTLLQNASLRSPMILSILRELGAAGDGTLNRTEIYEKMVEKLFAREAEMWGNQVYPLEVFKRIFSQLSFQLFDQGFIGRFPWEVAETLLPKLNITWGEFIRLTHLGLISELMEGSPHRGNDLIFRHQSFQEYFASLELKKRLLTQEGINYDLLLALLEYKKWDEVLSFLIGGVDSSSFKEILSLIKKVDPLLAAKCIASYPKNRDASFGKSIDGLINQMGLHDRIRAFGEIGSEQAVPSLLRLIEDSDEYVRWAAAEALGQIGSEQAVPSLLWLIEDYDEDVRWTAAGALGEIGSEQAIPSLLRLIEHPDADFRGAAARALGEIGSEQAVPSLLRLIENPYLGVWGAAAVALGEIGSEQAVPSLLRLTEDSNADIRGAAARALGRIGSEQAVPSLLRLTEDSIVDIRRSTAGALGRIGSEQAVPSLLRLIEDSHGDVRVAAADALGEIGSEQVVPSLLRLIENSDPDVQVAAARALGRIDSEQAVPPLLRLIEDSNVWVRGDAAGALGEIGSEQAVPPLLRLIEDSHAGVRRAAAGALGEIGSAQAVPSLIRLTEDSDAWVREAAAGALGEIGSAQAVPSLIQLTEDEDSDEGDAAAEALTSIAHDLNENSLVDLIITLHQKGGSETIQKIQAALGRRFLKILHPEIHPT